MAAASSVDAVGDDDYFFRRFIDDDNMIVFDENLQRFRPTSGAYKLDDDGVSGYLKSELQIHGLGSADVADKGGGDLVYAHNVGAIRALHEHADVVKAPDLPPLHRVDPAHALLTLPADIAKKPRLRFFGRLAKEVAELAFGEPSAPPHSA